MAELTNFFEWVVRYLTFALEVSYAPALSLIKSAACFWIAASIMRFKPDPGMQFKVSASLAATALFVLCIMEIARVVMGVVSGVSPFVSLIILILAYRLHVAKGNISNIRPV